MCSSYEITTIFSEIEQVALSLDIMFVIGMDCVLLDLVGGIFLVSPDCPTIKIALFPVPVWFELFFIEDVRLFATHFSQFKIEWNLSILFSE